MWLVMALKSQGFTLWGQVAESSRLCPIAAGPCILFIAGLPGTTSPARASREQAPLRSPKPQDSRIPATRPRADLWDSPTAATNHPTPLTMHLACTQRAQALRLAQSSRWLARERVRPGVTTALSLTLVAASLIGWQGPARGMRAGVPRSGTGCARRL